VAAAMSGDEINAAIDGLRGMVDRMNGFLSRAEEETARATRSRCASSCKALGGLRGAAQGVQEDRQVPPQPGHRNEDRERPHGGERGGFGVVAENVENMSSVRDQVRGHRERSAELESVLSRTITRVVEHQREIREKARVILGEAGRTSPR
jgi:hypothetical protein